MKKFALFLLGVIVGSLAWQYALEMFVKSMILGRMKFRITRY